MTDNGGISVLGMKLRNESNIVFGLSKSQAKRDGKLHQCAQGIVAKG